MADAPKMDPADSGPGPVAVVIFDLRARTIEPLGLFPSLARFSEMLEVEASTRGRHVLDPVAVNGDGQGSVRLADAAGEVVLEYHLVANDGSQYGRDGGVAVFEYSLDEEVVVACGVYVSEAYLRMTDEVMRQCIKCWEDSRPRRLFIPFSGRVGWRERMHEKRRGPCVASQASMPGLGKAYFTYFGDCGRV